MDRQLNPARLAALNRAADERINQENINLDAAHVAYNIGKLQQVWDNLPADARPGARAKLPNECLTIADTDDLAELYEAMHTGTGRMPNNWKHGWKRSLVPVEPPVATIPEKAAEELQQFLAHSPSALPAKERYPGAVPVAVQQAEDMSRLRPGNLPPTLDSTNVLAFIKFEKDMKKYYKDGGVTSMLSCINSKILSSIQLSIPFPEFDEFRTVDMQDTLERNILQYILLRYKTLTPTDIKLVEADLRRDTKMAPNVTGYFNCDNFDEYLGTFIISLKELKSAITQLSTKQICKIFAEGFRGDTVLRSSAMTAAETSPDVNSFLRLMADQVNEYRSVLPSIVMVASNAVKAASAKKFPPRGAPDGRKANAAVRFAGSDDAGAESESDPPPPPPPPLPVGVAHAAGKKKPVPLPPNYVCFNCLERGHKLWKCKSACTKCVPNVDGHLVEKCPHYLDLNKREAMMQVHYDRHSSHPISSTVLRTTSTNPIVASTSDVLRCPLPVIQFDCGANVLVSPSPPLGLPTVSASSLGSIQVADGGSETIESVTMVGNTECFIVPSFNNTLVPQSFVEDADCITVLSNKKISIFKNEPQSTLAKALRDNKPFISSESSNGLYFLQDSDLQDLANLQIKQKPLTHDFDLSASVATYHTVSYSSLADLVQYWHVVMNHANKAKMISIVQNGLYANLPKELTVDAIIKYFPAKCFDCTTDNLHQMAAPASYPFDTSIPAGAWWSYDFKKFSGADGEKSIPSYGGYTHIFAAIDYATGRVFQLPTKGTSNPHIYVQQLHEFNKSKGWVMYGSTFDDEFDTAECRKFNANSKIHPILRNADNSFTTSSNTIIINQIAIPYEHFTTGEIERFFENLHETFIKTTTSNNNIPDKLWAEIASSLTDIYNSLPTARHPNSSPYLLYDRFTIDVGKTPILPIGTIAIAHIPLEKQSLRTGRGIETVVIGRAPNHIGGISLFNPATKRVIVRRTFRILGKHAVRGFLFDEPINLALPFDDVDDDDAVPPFFDANDVPPTSTLPSVPLTSLLDTAIPPIFSEETDDISPDIPKLHYVPIQEKNVYKNQKHILKKIGFSFAELNEKDNNFIDAVNTIVDVVTTADHPRTFYYKYYDLAKPIPTSDDDFEYSLCSDVLKGGWATFETGIKIANAIKRNKREGLPTTFATMLNHAEAEGFLEAFVDEIGSWKSTGTLMPNYRTIDWKSVRKEDIGDLMLIFDKKYRPDGSFEKYKCRMVFRGDRYKDDGKHSYYESSIDNNSLMLFLAIAAADDPDILKGDVKTAFQKSDFPPGMVQ